MTVGWLGNLRARSDPDLLTLQESRHAYTSAVFCLRELGGVAEWSKAAVLKTAERELRGFESLLLRQAMKTE